jgi:7,8-dihydropterin-6-yl-methyl-4-(beta-D-ribofuranosyl)aminobenzene 5'-phosphate synthase
MLTNPTSFCFSRSACILLIRRIVVIRRERQVNSCTFESKNEKGANPGRVSTPCEAGTPWPGANFVPVSQTTEVVPGLFILPGVSTSPGTLELKELSLAIKSPQGLILIVGCSHPGVEHILQEASAIDPHVHILFGGLHQIQKPDPEVERIANVLHDQYKLDLGSPGHCTGEPECAALKKAFGDHYVYAGTGTVIELSRAQVASSASSGGRQTNTTRAYRSRRVSQLVNDLCHSLATLT